MKPKQSLLKSANSRSFALSLGLAVAATTQFAFGADFTWDGGGGDNVWGTGTNWVGDTAPTPGSGNSLIFSGTTRLTPQYNYGDGDDFKDITFDSLAGAFTISNTGANGIDWFGNINNNSSNTQTIGFRLYQSASNTINATSGNITLNSSALLFRNGQALTLTAASGKIITLAGVIADGGGGAGSAISVNGSGTVVFSGANTFTSGVNITSGTVSVSANNNLGANTAPVTLNGGTLRTTAGFTNTHPITVGASGGAINVSSTGQLFMDTANTLLGSGALTISGSSGTLLGQYANTGGNGGTGNNGNFRVNKTNTYSGNITLQSGGSFEYGVTNSVASGATFTLGNEGELSIGGVTVANAITVNGGTNSILSFQGAGTYSNTITLNANATIAMRQWYSYGTTVNGTISNQIVGAHTLDINSGTNAGTGGTLTLGGFDAKASSAALVLNSASLSISSNSGTAVASVTRGNSLTINSGNLTVAGVASQNTNDVFGTLNLGGGSATTSTAGLLQGYSTWTLTPNAATNTRLTFTNMGTRTAGSWAAINGTVGATPAANTANIFFTNALSSPNLIGSGGALTSGTASVIPWLRSASNATTIYGYDATVGIAPITKATVDINSATAGQNVFDNSSGSTLSADRTVNSLEVGDNNGGNYNLGTFTLTVSSGVIVAGTSPNFNGGTLNFGSAEAQLSASQVREMRINSSISGSGGLTFVGYSAGSTKGRLILSGANTYTGVTNFFGYGSAGGNAEVRLANSLALQNTTVNYVAGRASAVVFGNGGTPPTSFTFGGLTGNAGINLNNNATAGAQAIALTIGSAGSADTASTVNTYSGVLSNTVTGGSIIKDGVATQVLSGANTYSGGTTFKGGVLRIDNANALGTTGNLTFSGGKLQYGAGITPDLSARIAAGTSVSAVSVDTNGNNVIFATALAASQSGGLTKSGNGTLNLNAANTYTGATTISGGTLALGATGSIDSTSGVSLGTGGTFDVSAKSGYAVAQLTGSGNVLGALTVSTTLAIGNSPGTTDFGSHLTLGATSTYIYELTGGLAPGSGSADLGNVAGDLTLTAGSVLDLFQLGTYTAGNKFTLFSYLGSLGGTFRDVGNVVLNDGDHFTDAGGSWMIDYNDTEAGANGGTPLANYVTITAVPEPNAAMLIGGLGVLCLLRRRRI